MKKTYDPLNSGFAELYKDIEKIKNDLIWVNQVAVASLEKTMLTRLTMNSYVITNPENAMIVLTQNSFRYRRNKYQPAISMVNRSEQATYSEYGYGIVGARSPLLVSQQIFGDVKWKGYNILPGKKRDDFSWYYTNRFVENPLTYGERSAPTYYLTYMYFKENISRIIGEKIEAMLKKL